jgi:hypothetical protein
MQNINEAEMIANAMIEEEAPVREIDFWVEYYVKTDIQYDEKSSIIYTVVIRHSSYDKKAALVLTADTLKNYNVVDDKNHEFDADDIKALTEYYDYDFIMTDLAILTAEAARDHNTDETKLDYNKEYGQAIFYADSETCVQITK